MSGEKKLIISIFCLCCLGMKVLCGLLKLSASVSVTMAYFRDSKMENRNAIRGEKIFHPH